MTGCKALNGRVLKGFVVYVADFVFVLLIVMSSGVSKMYKGKVKGGNTVEILLSVYYKS